MQQFKENCLTNFNFFYFIQKPATEARTPSILILICNRFLFALFSLDFNDFLVSLTKTVSRIWSIFKNQNTTIVAWAGTFFVCVIDFRAELSGEDDSLWLKLSRARMKYLTLTFYILLLPVVGTTHFKFFMFKNRENHRVVGFKQIF
jgi:hypothetical protein